MNFSTSFSPLAQAKSLNLKSIKFMASSKPDMLEISANRPDKLKKIRCPSGDYVMQNICFLR